MQKKLQVSCAATLVLIVGSLIGCEKAQESTASGLVTIDGKPLTGGSITFISGSRTNARPATGGIKSDGTYRVQIAQSGKLMAGEYVVRVSSRGPSIPHPEGGPPELGELLTPAHYAKTDTSGLRFNIRSGDNIIDIPLVSDPVESLEETPVEGDATESESPAGIEAVEEPSEEEPAVAE